MFFAGPGSERMAVVRENSCNEREEAGNSDTEQGGQKNPLLKKRRKLTDLEKLMRGITD